MKMGRFGIFLWRMLGSQLYPRGLLSPQVLKLVDSCFVFFFVSVVFKNIEDGNQWLFSRVYGPNDDSCKSVLWDELVGVCALWDLP